MRLRYLEKSRWYMHIIWKEYNFKNTTQLFEAFLVEVLFRNFNLTYFQKNNAHTPLSKQSPYPVTKSDTQHMNTLTPNITPKGSTPHRHDYVHSRTTQAILVAFVSPKICENVLIVFGFYLLCH